MTLNEYKEFSNLVEEEIYEKLLPQNVVDARISYGGTGKSAVLVAINEAKLQAETLYSIFLK